MYGHDVRHTGQSEYVSTLTPGLNWSYKLRSATGSNSPPAIDSNGKIYIGTASAGNNLLCMNSDCSLSWSYTTGSDLQYSCPAIGAEGEIYFTASNFNLYAMNSDGTLSWTYKVNTSISGSSSPAIGSDGEIYLGRQTGLGCWEQSGSLRWSYNIGAAINSSPAIGSDESVYCGGGT
ncbi:MAG: PQQ-binding-like beta-propeller repeat protein, partial [Candidatus Aureabacteria bacterium]|nr:PQQ-binding-like beta-propeller repeat protein [Candidatus Auribacterota bacterium]